LQAAEEERERAEAGYDTARLAEFAELATANATEITRL
jgi:hypothetical protein